MTAIIKKTDYILLFITIGGFVFRLTYYIFDPVISRDAALYLNITESMISNNFSIEQLPAYESIPPLTFYIVALISKVLNVSILKAGIALNIALGTLFIIIAFASFKILFDDSISRYGATALLSFSPILTKYSTMFQRETVYIFFCCCALYFLISFRKKMI